MQHRYITNSDVFFFFYPAHSYGTIYTMFPVFSLVLDKDVSGKIALTYPELYKELSKGRSLSYKTFFMWILISIYQGKYFQALANSTPVYVYTSLQVVLLCMVHL